MKPSLRWLLLLCLVLSCGLSHARRIDDASPPAAPGSSAGPARQALTVGVKVAPPFVIAEGDHYRGLAIDLWQEAAADHGWTYHYRAYDLEGLLDAVARGEVDVGVGAITATAAREHRMDFSHPLTSSGLGIAVHTEQSAGWMAVARALVSPEFLKVIATLSLVLLAIGLLVWLVERHHNPDQFGGGRGRGIFSGFWWAMVTMTTVGYGDVAPRTIPGRLIGMAWMLTALIVVSFFTASITSALTVGQLSQRIHNVDDLATLQVTSVPGSTSAAWLERRHIDYHPARDLDSALASLAAGDTGAVVYDAPLLRYEIGQRYRRQLQVVPLVLERQDYAFALPSRSPLREPIDTSLLERINRGDWNDRLKRYFGSSATP